MKFITVILLFGIYLSHCQSEFCTDIEIRTQDDIDDNDHCKEVKVSVRIGATEKKLHGLNNLLKIGDRFAMGSPKDMFEETDETDYWNEKLEEFDGLNNVKTVGKPEDAVRYTTGDGYIGISSHINLRKVNFFRNLETANTIGIGQDDFGESENNAYDGSYKVKNLSVSGFQKLKKVYLIGMGGDNLVSINGFQELEEADQIEIDTPFLTNMPKFPKLKKVHYRFKLRYFCDNPNPDLLAIEQRLEIKPSEGFLVECAK